MVGSNIVGSGLVDLFFLIRACTVSILFFKSVPYLPFGIDVAVHVRLDDCCRFLSAHVYAGEYAAVSVGGCGYLLFGRRRVDVVFTFL